MSLELLDIPQHPMGAFQCNGGRQLTRLYKSSGGGGSYYESLERLYDEQAQSARMLRQQAEKYLPGMTDAYAREVNDVLDKGYADRQAEQAGADMAGANAMERAATSRQLASMGVNPADRRYATSMAAQESANAARMAAGQNIARQDAKNMQRAVAQDAVGTFTGQSNQASSQLNSAASGFSRLAEQQSAQAAQQSQNIANVVGGTMALGSAIRSFRDGGRIRAEKGGHKQGQSVRASLLERHMLGGAAGSQQGFFQMQSIAPPPPSPAAAQAGPVDLALQGVQSYQGMQKGIEGVKAMYGKLSGETAKLGADVVASATTETGAALGSMATETAATEAVSTVAADAAATAAGSAATTAAGTAAGTTAGTTVTAGSGLMGAMGTAGAAVSTALPWVGAAIAVGSLLDVWKDGGEIRVQQAIRQMTPAQRKAAASAYEAAAREAGDPAVAAQYRAFASCLGGARGGNRTIDYRSGDEVEGPGGHTDDLVPALLSDGEHVINAEAAALIGHRQLERLNQQGLALRARGLTPEQIGRRVIRLNQNRHVVSELTRGDGVMRNRRKRG